jgi:hypothetical protein
MRIISLTHPKVNFYAIDDGERDKETLIIGMSELKALNIQEAKTKTFKSFSYVELNTPIYEGYINKLTFTQENGYKYAFWVKLNSLASLTKLKSILSKSSDGNNSLANNKQNKFLINYYRQVILQTSLNMGINDTDNDFKEEVRTLVFNDLENVVDERGSGSVFLKSIKNY